MSARPRRSPLQRTPRTGTMDARRFGLVLRRLRAMQPRWNLSAIEGVNQTAGRDPFRILVACVLSLRTRDETTGPAAQRLFAVASTPPALLALSEQRIASLVYPVAFYRRKATALRRICSQLLERHDGHVPSDLDALLALPGVGRKTANLVRTVGFGLPGICVDTHVHRIANRLGFVATRTPAETEAALRARLPRRHWIGLNDLLVTFGQNVCHPTSPRCSSCPVAALCPRRGVRRSR